MVQGAVRTCGCPPRRPSSTRSRRWHERTPPSRCWRARTASRRPRRRSARSSLSSRTGCAASCAASRPRSTSARSTARRARTARTSPPSPAPTGSHVSQTFVEHLGLTWNPLTTQIESHDWQAELYADVARFNRDPAQPRHGRVDLHLARATSPRCAARARSAPATMPHKVNPIRFENGEANLELSCALLDTLGATLVTSRLQRDLTDSTTQRNIGPAFGHSLLAIDNVRRGLAGLDVDAAAMERDLDANWEVLGEADPVGDARRRRRRGPRDGPALRAAQGAHARAPDHRRGHARVRRRPRPARGRRRAALGDDPRLVHRCRRRARRASSTRSSRRSED